MPQKSPSSFLELLFSVTYRACCMADAVFVTLHTCTISSTFWRVAFGFQFSRRSNSVLISKPYCTTAKSHWKKAAGKHLLVTTVDSENESSLKQLAQKSQKKILSRLCRKNIFLMSKWLLNMSNAETRIVVNIL